MSEYQYYEFQAIDRRLTAEEMRQLRAVSSRASISPSRFTNSYEWGDFKGDPAEWMEKYFDAFLYLANWGTHQLMLRVPASLLPAETAAPYCVDDISSAWTHDGFTILSFASEDDSGDGWDDDGSGLLSSILPVRQALAEGDHRALYLAWLLGVQTEEVGEDEPEPPVPPGLRAPTAGLTAFGEFLRIDPDLLYVAAEKSAPMEAAPGAGEMAEWIARLPEAEKNALLTRVARGEATHVGAEMRRRFRADHTSETADSQEPRTAGELLAAAKVRAGQRRREEAERAARERVRREREAAERHARYLDELATREPSAWLKVDALASEKNASAYEEAVSLLIALRDLADRDGRAEEAEARTRALLQRHSTKRSFLQRYAAAENKRRARGTSPATA